MTRTKIGIIGAGNMAGPSPRLVAAGHNVSVTAKDPAHAEDAAAKAGVRGMIEGMGFEAVDAGPLGNARLLEPLGMLNIYLGYAGGRGTSIAPVWVAVT